MDFEPSARTRDLTSRLQAFMDEHVYPAEAVYDAQVAGAANPHELVEAYAADGRPVDELAWFDALGRYKMAAIMGHNLRRHLEGRHHDPDQERLPDTIERLIATGLSTTI